MKLAGTSRPAYFLYHLLWCAIDWVFPPTCGGCGKPGVRWCEECQNKVLRISSPICPRCGEAQPDDETCQNCRQHPPEYEALRSFGVFDGPLRDALHRMKYQRDIGLGEPLSKHLIGLYNDLKWEIDMIVPVPLGTERLKERGYNQSGLLARPLAFSARKAFLPGILNRTRDTRTQVGLSAKERRENVDGAFSSSDKSVQGKVVLIVDDVTTTGSTISACAKALRAAGASKVYGLTLARAVLKTHNDAQPIPTHIKRR